MSVSVWIGLMIAFIVLFIIGLGNEAIGILSGCILYWGLSKWEERDKRKKEASRR